MTRSLLLLPLLLGASDAGARIEVAQLRIEQRVIIRVPLAVPPPPPASRPPVVRQPFNPPAAAWRERKGPKCLKMKDIRAADVSDDGIDMLTGDGRRFRATLETGCKPDAFFSAFYMEPTRDGALCAGRDAIQARGGAQCKVDKFHLMVPAK